ncbi:acetyltransferase [Legionella gratiana]|uniref:Acetyltransferase n=1 Tax=Legionella gratiana TaxID=45066 RepID=A0A378JCQ5_9GAMM|nr:acyltransferase family protein [Legionella gratiana]KTD10990.1 acetyltransferase [Legionella gratiana]STX44667.1 acetyltransferase [Legionella gratiana]
MRYRPDVDGLRAIAIFFVICFHAGFSLFPSGFIGVDIFFVISGFLITNIIYNSLQNNRFSFIDFYSRRLWRLQPIFICMIVSTLLLTLIFYLPEDLIQYSKSARKTSLFLSNIFFERITKGYFSPNVNQLPLVHTWSLSIEWQCYLILPVLIYGVYRVVNEKYIARITYLLTLFFLIVALFFSVKEPAKNYYQLSSRVFEFLIGSCIAFRQNTCSLNKHLVEGLNIAAVCILFYIAMHAPINRGFPNWYAVVLCCATGILILSGGNHPQTILTRVLSMKPIVFIGLLSYSLYIWHWPIFVFIRYLKIEETTPVLLCAGALTFIIAYFSWRFIEKPARQFHTIRFAYSLIYLCILPIVLIHMGDYAIKKQEGYPQRFTEMARINKQLKQYSYPLRPLCLQDKSVEINTNCVLGAKNSNTRTGFMFGDSHANHLWGFMDALAKKANLSILAHTTAACLSLPGIEQYDWNREVYTACHEQIKRYYTMIKNNHYDFVILGQNWDGYLGGKLITNEPVESTQKRIEKALEDALQIIITSGATPVLLKTIVINDSYHCFLNHIKLRKKYKPKECDFAMQSNWQDDLFLRLKNKYTQLIIIDPKQAQCIEGQCNADINGIPVFRDSGHITDYASYHLATRYLQRYQNPLI